MLWFGLADETQSADGPTPPPPPTGEPPGAEPEDDDESGADALIMSLLPWGTSFLTHAGIVLLALFIAWSTIDHDEDEKERIIPLARLSKTPSAPVKAHKVREMSKSATRQRSTLVSPSTARAPTRRTATIESTLIGAVGRAAGGNPFGSGLSTGSGEGASFFGIEGGNVRRIVYLIDASGSLIDSLDYVIIELKRSINNLNPEQLFTVIFFQGDEVLEVRPRAMKPATAENKAKVIEWIDPKSGNVAPMLPGNPVPALRLALQYSPELIFILSDNITGSGRYEIDQRRLLEEIEKANKADTAISTIQFLYRDKLEDYGLKPTLEVIAMKNGGKYKFVDARELGIE